MASVRITEDIRNHVKAKIDALFADRKKNKLEELQHLDIGRQMYEKKIPAAARQLAETLNGTDSGRWVTERETLSVKMSYTDHKGVACTYSFQVKFVPPVLVPLRGFGEQYSTYEMPQDIAAYPLAVKVMREFAVICEECEKLHAALGGLFRASGTLRQVLERWPTALDFVDDATKKRHAAKTEKVERAEIPQVDIEAQALLMKARMLNPNA
jgi:hypothetical protein